MSSFDNTRRIPSSLYFCKDTPGLLRSPSYPKFPTTGGVYRGKPRTASAGAGAHRATSGGAAVPRAEEGGAASRERPPDRHTQQDTAVVLLAFTCAPASGPRRAAPSQTLVGVLGTDLAAPHSRLA